MAKNVKKGSIYEEDLAKNTGSGSATASRTTSTGGSQTLTKLGAGDPWYFGNINNILFVDGVKYATVDAAITAAGSAKTLIIVPSTYAGADPSSIPDNVTILDLTGGTPSGSIDVNVETASGQHSRWRVNETRSSPASSTSAIYATEEVSGALPASNTTAAGTFSAIPKNALSSVGAGQVLVGVEGVVDVQSTGQTLADIRGGTFSAVTAASSTTNVTDAVSIFAQDVTKGGSGTITNAYGVVAETQTVGSTRNYSLWNKGAFLQSNDRDWDVLDSGGVVRKFLTFTATDLLLFRPLLETAGFRFSNQANTSEWLLIKNGQAYFFDDKLNINSSGRVAKYNGIATVAGGIPAEYAAVDLTAQTAAITTTTLYAVPASGAGQYRVSWNAKVTTAATTGAATSTLGALTIVYTDPDGVVQTITAPASLAAGTIATSSAGNSTTTVLLGLPLTLNCKASTNITYAMAYASDTAAQMAFNLHLKLEAL